MIEVVSVRRPAIAGSFYPADPDVLRRQIDGFLAAVAPRDDDAAPPKALIAPHAGTIYSGPIAASAYATLAPVAERIERVVLLGPAHRVFVRGLVVPTVDHFRTPLGDVPIDRELVDRVQALPGVSMTDAPHVDEHSLEVHLPFLQRVLGGFTLLPLVVGQAEPAMVAAVLDRVWGGPETLVVVSSDLSHFHDYESARRLDRETSAMIERLDFETLDGERACGAHPVSGLLSFARSHAMTVHCVDLRNSGDTAGTPDRVVGYGSYVVC
jgi:MEMO1 family protein